MTRRLIVALLLVTGCGSAEHPFAELCDGRDLEVCDVIEDPSCRAVIFDYTACLRESRGAAIPAFEVVTRDELIENRVTPTDTSTINRVLRTLSLIDLMPDTDDPSGAFTNAQVQNIGAVYSPETHTISLVEASGPARPLEAIRVYAHEAVHAMQFADRDIEGLYSRFGGDDDRNLAITSIVEGEAQLYSAFVLDGFAQRTAGHRSASGLDLFRREATDAPLALTRAVFPYTFGHRYVLSAWFNRGYHAAIDDVFETPPITSRQILEGWTEDRTRSSSTTWAPGMELAPELPVALADYRLRGRLVLGDWHMRVFALRSELTLPGQWIADRFFAYYDDAADSAAFVWIIRLSAPFGEPAEGLIDLRALPSTLEELQNALDDPRWRYALGEEGRLLVLAGADAQVAEPWAEVVEALTAPR